MAHHLDLFICLPTPAKFCACWTSTLRDSIFFFFLFFRIMEAVELNHVETGGMMHYPHKDTKEDSLTNWVPTMHASSYLKWPEVGLACDLVINFVAHS